MNRNRKPIAKHNRKEMEKSIKKGQKNLVSEDLPRTDTLTPKKALNKYPSKRQKVEKPLMNSIKKSMETKKKKTQAKHSKRTTPGEVDHRESPPAEIHKESTRWKQTLDIQAKAKRKALSANLRKNQSKKRP